jgi:hypothetical protein
MAQVCMQLPDWLKVSFSCLPSIYRGPAKSRGVTSFIHGPVSAFFATLLYIQRNDIYKYFFISRVFFQTWHGVC